jgi:acyl dehydratase
MPFHLGASMYAFWFDDIRVGVVRKFGGIDVRAGDIVLFVERFAPHLPLRATQGAVAPSARGPAAPQALLYGLWTRMLWEETGTWPVRARLGQDALRWYKTAHAGDTLSVKLCFVAKDDVAIDHGLLIAQHDVMNQEGELIFSIMTRTLIDKEPRD